MAGLDETSRSPDGRAPVRVSTRRRFGRIAPGVAAVVLAVALGACAEGARPEWTVAPGRSPAVASAFACPPASTPDRPGAVDQARPTQPYVAMAFDRRAGSLVAVAGPGDGLETWTFDVCSNTWTRMHPSREPDGIDAWDRSVYDVDSHVTIVVDRETGSVWAYDLQADTWTRKGAAPTDARLGAYDPISGLVVAARDADPIELWTYDVDTDTWTPIQQADGPGDGVFAYDASVDRIVAYTGKPETWLFDIRSGTWSRSRSSAETLAVVAGWGPPHTIEYAETARRTVIMSNAGAATYDASANRWEYVVGREPGWVPDTMVYDPVNERLVGPGPWFDAAGVHMDREGVVAFDPVTREWTVLLEPTDGQPVLP